MKKLIKNIFFLLLIVFLYFAFQSDVDYALRHTIDSYLPCAVPQAYSLGEFDERFGMTREEFIRELEKAEQKWEDAIGKDLFVYKEDGAMKVNLIYDNRQGVTDRLEEINQVIDSGQGSYDKVKAEYDALKASYQNDKNSFEVETAEFNRRNNAYNKEVSYWNSMGGAPASTYQELERERQWLNNEAYRLNDIQRALNRKIDELNAMGGALNKLASSLNMQVANYNNIQREQGGEFEEGLYHFGPDGKWIDIYQFENDIKLERILMHEFGHALGMDHVKDQESIMYFLNSSNNTDLTLEDIDELKRACNSSIIKSSSRAAI